MMRRLSPDSVWQVPSSFQKIYAHAIEISAPGKLLLISGQIGIAPDGALPDLFEQQCKQAMSNVEALLTAADMATGDILRVTYYVTDPKNLAALSDIRQDRWGSTEPPAVTTLVVAALARPELLIEIEATAGA